MICLLLNGCAGTASLRPDTYIVQPQDTLYSIAWRHDIDFRDLAQWNHIGPDFHISTGQILLLQAGLAPPDTPPHPPVHTPPHTPPNLRPRPGTKSAPTAPNAVLALPIKPPPPSSRTETQASPSVTSATHQWVWPTDRSSNPRAVPGGGILLTGHLGQEVRAACGGRVVYAGSGLRGYGNLIIVKHAENLLSAYAHNRELLVHEGKEVNAGDAIARMGEGPNHVAVLYFEIRQNGKPVDPFPYLARP